MRIKLHKKISLRWSFIVLGIVGISFASVIIFFLNLAIPDQNSSAELALLVGGGDTQNSVQATTLLPIRLEIPEINIDTVLEYVGLTPQGDMAVTEGPMEPAWFYLGPAPGQNGSAVIAGHDGWKDDIPAIFDNLYKLKIGDKLYIENETGAVITFVVHRVATYENDQDFSDVFISNDGKAHLNLITCEGTWNAITKSYSNRLVVFTDEAE